MISPKKGFQAQLCATLLSNEQQQRLRWYQIYMIDILKAGICFNSSNGIKKPIHENVE